MTSTGGTIPYIFGSGLIPATSLNGVTSYHLQAIAWREKVGGPSTRQRQVYLNTYWPDQASEYNDRFSMTPNELFMDLFLNEDVNPTYQMLSMWTQNSVFRLKTFVAGTKSYSVAAATPTTVATNIEQTWITDWDANPGAVDEDQGIGPYWWFSQYNVPQLGSGTTYYEWTDYFAFETNSSGLTDIVYLGGLPANSYLLSNIFYRDQFGYQPNTATGATLSITLT